MTPTATMTPLSLQPGCGVLWSNGWFDSALIAQRDGAPPPRDCSLKRRHELRHLRPTLASSISAFHMSQLLLANRFVLGFLLTKVGT